MKESLLIMTQHNMVDAAMPTEREMRRARASRNAAAGPANIKMHYTVSELVSMRLQYQASDLLRYLSVSSAAVTCFATRKESLSVCW